jgi:hypothetical protein
MFDPSWFAEDGEVHDPSDVASRLRDQLRIKHDQPRLGLATRACREFLALGGKLKMEDLSSILITRYLSQGIPIITGLSSTFLYREAREIGPLVHDDIRGTPQGHFVMLLGYDSRKREVMVADPLDENPPFHTRKYRLSLPRLLNAILLGILTHDANLLIVTPKRKRRKARVTKAGTKAATKGVAEDANKTMKKKAGKKSPRPASPRKQ